VRSAALLALAALLLGAACGGGEEPEPAPPPAEPVPASSPPAPPASPPRGGVVVPSGALRGDAARGAELYAQYCWVCHGAEGRGDGPSSAGLVPRPADHTDTAYMGALSDEHLYRVIHGGGPAVGKSPLMTPWGGVLGEQDIRDLIAHLRRISET
jgi:mono/diheme cytochrome c family protein